MPSTLISCTHKTYYTLMHNAKLSNTFYSISSMDIVLQFFYSTKVATQDNV